MLVVLVFSLVGLVEAVIIYSNASFSSNRIEWRFIVIVCTMKLVVLLAVFVGCQLSPAVLVLFI